MADKKSYRNIQFRKRTKRQQLITPTASLQSLFSGSNTSINAASTSTPVASTVAAATPSSPPPPPSPSISTASTATTATSEPIASSGLHRSFNPISGFNSNRSSKKGKMGKKVEKDKPPKERWLLTRKTWKYMKDAGRSLIPQNIQNRGNTNDPNDLKKIEEYFQHVCSNEPKFLPVFRRKQSFPGAFGVSPFRRSGKLRHTHRWFGRSTNRLAPINDKSSGSSNVSSPPTNFEESDDDGGGGGGMTANDSQRMFLIIEMLEKYLKLSSDTSPLGDGDGGSSSPTNEYDSSAFTSPDNLSPPPVDKADASSTDAAYKHQYQQQQQPQSPTKKYSFGSNEDASTSKSSTHTTSFASSESSASYRATATSIAASSAANSNRRPIGNQHTSLLLENLRNYGRKNRSSLLSSMNFTPAVLEDKQLLRRIRDELKQQQLGLILNRNSRRPMAADTSGMRMPTTTSLFTLPTLKPVPARTNIIERDGITYTLTSIPTTSADGGGDHDSGASSPSSRVPLISIKCASQDKTQAQTREIQTDPIPINNIYQQYHNYLKQLEKEKEATAKGGGGGKGLLCKSMSAGGKATGLTDATSKHSKRKSSIDEDVSQSVSDTIKRYLRMARKKPANDAQANQFKRINYDTNLRNITSKAEIPKPDELEVGNTKTTQTNDNWSELAIQEIKMHMSVNDNKQLPLSDCTDDFHHHMSGASYIDRKPTSSSTPTSPTGFFHSSTHTLIHSKFFSLFFIYYNFFSFPVFVLCITVEIYFIDVFFCIFLLLFGENEILWHVLSVSYQWFTLFLISFCFN